MENQQPKFKVWWDEENKILMSKCWGDNYADEDAKALAEETIKIAETRPGKILLLNDLSEARAASVGARKIFAQLAKNEKFLKNAFWGMKTLTRIMVSFVMKAAGTPNVKFFATEEEALKWLKEK